MADTNKTPSAYARRTPSTDNLRAWIAEAEAHKSRALPKGSAAVLIPILIRDGKYHVLYEVRSAKLKTQPGEVCFPGGRIEQGETPGEAAIREACEELCITRDQMEIVGARRHPFLRLYRHSEGLSGHLVGGRGRQGLYPAPGLDPGAGSRHLPGPPGAALPG